MMKFSSSIIYIPFSFNHTEGFIGAFPTYAMDGTVRLRPVRKASRLLVFLGGS